MMNVYSVRDKVLKKVAPPFAAPNHEAAIRSFKSIRFPEGSPVTDFELIQIGEYDEDRGDYLKIIDGGELAEPIFGMKREVLNG